MREGGATEAGIIMGTLGMHVTGAGQGRRGGPGDCFSFGCVLYEMLSGTAPFARGTHTETLAAIRAMPPHRSSRKSRDPQRAAADRAEGAREGESDRFASAGELHQELEAFRQSVVDAEAGSCSARCENLAAIPPSPPSG